MENKSIILSGPSGSGKSIISYAMQMTHQAPLVVSAHEVTKKAYERARFENLSFYYTGLFIDECTLLDILFIQELFELHKISVPWFGDDDIVQGRIPLVFLTQEKVTQKDVDSSKFFVVECTYPGLRKS
jgi:ABC-type dipeptide/oligopeptide/nickel transport system ATPase component